MPRCVLLLLLLHGAELASSDALSRSTSSRRASRLHDSRLIGRGARWLVDRVRGGEQPAQEEEEVQRGRMERSRRGFYPEVYEELGPTSATGGDELTSFCVQQVQGTGDCLFHSIAIGMAFEDEACHLDMYDSTLSTRVATLRQQAVDALVDDPSRVLHLEGDQTISTDELVAAAAEQYSMKPEEYCTQMRNQGVWGGGPEILALVNKLQRPIHVFEPVPVNNGTQVRMQLCGAFGSPKFDACGPRVCILAADDRFPNCKPDEVKRHGEGGNHFLALLPCPPANNKASGEEPPAEKAEGSDSS